MEPLRNSQNHTAKQESTDEPRLRVNWGMGHGVGHGVRHVVTFYRFLSFSHKEKWHQILALPIPSSAYAVEAVEAVEAVDVPR